MSNFYSQLRLSSSIVKRVKQRMATTTVMITRTSFTTTEGSRPTIVHKRSLDILHDPWFNKGTAFSMTERDRLDLRGLLPPNVMSAQQQIDRSSLYDEIIPAFDIMGKKSFFLGQVGNGAKMKLVVNMIMGSMMNAFSEGLVLSDRSGLSQQTLLEVLELGAIATPMFKMKGPAMIQNNYAPAFPLKHQQKDMRLALLLGDQNAVSMPVAAASNEAFKKARNMGFGEHDFSAVYETVKSLGDSK